MTLARSIFAFLGFLLILLCLSSMAFSEEQTGSPPSSKPDPEDRKWWEKAYKVWAEESEIGIYDPATGWHYYWWNGLRMDSPEKNFTIRIFASIYLDGGDVGFRRLRISGSGTLYDFAEFKLDIDFADVRDIKDNWIRFNNIPYIDHVTLGHMKEPLSLEEWTSGNVRTFMERALPVDAFAFGRNIGIRRHTAVLDQRMTWAVGAFLNMGSFGSVGDASDRISEANGFDLTVRVTGLPWYEEDGRNLLHLGLGYSRAFRDEDNTDAPARFRTRPESFLTDDRFVDTGSIFASGQDLINIESALVRGPLSFQGEFFYTFTDADKLGTLDFWGFYVYGSYFITGEHRNYGRRSAAFFRQEPKRDFRPRKGGWGAWELGLRMSYVDLNDEAIRGGKEFNVTAGLNWYVNPKSRFMFNYIRPKVKDRETPPAVDDGTADILQARFQFLF
jgi:phosphate-selective porin OprO/OprP